MMHVSTSESFPLAAQRQAEIAALLARDGRVVAGHLAVRFDVSEDTIRRDLREMAAEGRCRRVYGGALPAAPDEGTLAERAGQAAPRKAALAAALARTIVPGSCLFLDAGSTNLAVANALPAEANLTVVTNAPGIAHVLAGRGRFEIIVIGGRLDVASGACLGPQALRDLERFRFSALVLGACGVDAVAGVTAHVFEEAELKAAAAARSASVLVAAINAKIGTAAAFHVLPASGISTLFVEADCPASRLAPFEAARIRAIRAAPPLAAEATGLRRSRKTPSASVVPLPTSNAKGLPGASPTVTDSGGGEGRPAALSREGDVVPRHDGSDDIPLQPRGDAVPRHPPGGEAPDHPPGGEAPDHLHGGEAPQHLQGGKAPGETPS
ncbi:DeoR/GlpR family DNA-binding transcription regulator [Aureimonas sp. Leaf454]|uniref:DeoR/GlpR family DNA-binding transcription regulator n=1 Tax=Aureimonas sp. Leaf454 TaxID=1736381 RepID=UPI000B203E9C|nr:DeoR/GlpR family DNA-binding transcription regulator [Aureimonas sp. Leaf454]